MARSSRQASQARPSPRASRSHSPQSPMKSIRHATVYDAVADRVSTQGFLPSQPYIPSTRDTPSSSTIPIPPDEVLFRSINAPTRYEENDIYRMDRFLKPDQELPESDLLKALHAYAADFYHRSVGPEANSSYGSMDGSALIALGILMEEICKEALGKTGDLAFVEGEEMTDEAEEIAPNNDRRGIIEGGRDDSSFAKAPNPDYPDYPDGQDTQNTQDDQGDSGAGHGRRKRRKVRHKVSTGSE